MIILYDTKYNIIRSHLHTVQRLPIYPNTSRDKEATLAKKNMAEKKKRQPWRKKHGTHHHNKKETTLQNVFLKYASRAFSNIPLQSL